MRTEEYEGKKYFVFSLPEESLGAVNETWRQVLLFGHCEAHYARRSDDDIVVMIEERKVVLE